MQVPTYGDGNVATVGDRVLFQDRVYQVKHVLFLDWEHPYGVHLEGHEQVVPLHELELRSCLQN